MEIEPKEFWEDMCWGREHYSDFVEKYPDKWIAIVNKSVVAVGEGIKEIRRIAKKKTGKFSHRSSQINTDVNKRPFFILTLGAQP